MDLVVRKIVTFTEVDTLCSLDDIERLRAIVKANDYIESKSREIKP